MELERLDFMATMWRGWFREWLRGRFQKYQKVVDWLSVYYIDSHLMDTASAIYFKWNDVSKLKIVVWRWSDSRRLEKNTKNSYNVSPTGS